MKLRITIAAVAVLFAVVFTACETEYADTSTPEANLISLKIRVNSGEMVMESIPQPIGKVDWNDEDYDIYGEDYNEIAFKNTKDVEGAWFEPVVSKGARVKWGTANNKSVRPGSFIDTRVPATIGERTTLYFEVISEDGEKANYYRFTTYISSPVKELASITIAGREGSIRAPGPTWDDPIMGAGAIDITAAEATNATIEAVPKYTINTTVRFAAQASDRVEPVFSENNVLTFRDGWWLFIEVTAENGEQNIYLFNVFVSRIATIRKLTFKTRPPGATEDKEVEALGKGTGLNTWTDNKGAGSFESPHQPAPTGFGFSVELDDPDGQWQWAKLSSLPGSSTPQPNNWSNLLPHGASAALPYLDPLGGYNNDEYLAIKVTPYNTAAGPNRAYYFYKVKIGLLGAEFTLQPKSAVYVHGTPAEPLMFDTDQDEDEFDFQWWEANSWYGGYGFDSEGKIGKKGPMDSQEGWGDHDAGILKSDGTFEYLPSPIDHGNTKTPKQAIFTLAASNPGSIPFDVSGWHQEELDEKDNVSLHNGGNEYYNLSTPGKPIPNATGRTFTPLTNYTPFLAGFTNETHYYWVVATHKVTGLQATSKRAFIVTEWNEQFKNGQNLGPMMGKDKDGKDVVVVSPSVPKKHYIIDLYAYQRGPDADGLRASPQNPTPFVDGSHRDGYVIPLKFPDGFDIKDYSVVTAQALFYLADGRMWIQNWTQGDFGFYAHTNDDKTHGPTCTVQPGRGAVGTYDDSQVVLWYNLTNDNATRGLAASGNEPSGGGLDVTPTHLIIKPAGTKPIKDMPDFDTDTSGAFVTDILGRPVPKKGNNAQGWFTPYIEICEIRFEGPAR